MPKFVFVLIMKSAMEHLGNAVGSRHTLLSTQKFALVDLTLPSYLTSIEEINLYEEVLSDKVTHKWCLIYERPFR